MWIDAYRKLKFRIFPQFTYLRFVLNTWERILSYEKLEIIEAWMRLGQDTSKNLFLRKTFCKIYLEKQNETKQIP